MTKKVFYLVSVILVGVLALLGGGFLHLYEDRSGLQNKVIVLEEKLIQKDKREVLNNGLFDSADFLAASLLQNVISKKDVLLRAGEPFMFVDLGEMKLELYGSDGISSTLPVLTKGRVGSWWETPTGDYSVLAKEQNHFSSIGRVWMPWSVQFYGNFFIHGWPYHEDGEPVPQTYSGGCIRLSTDDAKVVYDFLKKGMPILIREDKNPDEEFLPLTTQAYLPAPIVTASSTLVIDLSGKNILLDKAGDKVFPMASLAKLMTGVVASELIYLERSITLTSAMLSAKIQSFPFVSGDNYSAFDLLYPALMESSNGAASALAAFVGEGQFVKSMNAKARSLDMKNTTFVDPAGIGDGNKATARDLAALAQYILDKRSFLFDITKGKSYLTFGPSHFSDIKNFNEFANEGSLIGMKNGETTNARQAILSVWKLKDQSGVLRNIAIIVLGSDNRAKDTEALLDWTKQSFALE